MDAVTLVGALATLASTTSFAPQAWKIVKTRDTGAISVRMYAITVAGFALWLAYGVMLGQWPLIATNGVCLLLSSFILAMKLLPQGRREAVAATLDPATPTSSAPAASRGGNGAAGSGGPRGTPVPSSPG
jgi:MtN3 and saliva related transmembrane protein